jgi:hypothetical protein
MEYGLIAALIAVSLIAVVVVSNRFSPNAAPVPNFPKLHHGGELHGESGINDAVLS